VGNANKPFNYAPLPAGDWIPAGGGGLAQYDASNDRWAVYVGRGNYDITNTRPANVPAIVPNQGTLGQLGEALSNGWGAAVSLVFGGASALGSALGGAEASAITAPATSEATTVNLSQFIGDLPVAETFDYVPEEVTTGAFDISGSEGVFDSSGNPLYNSPGFDVSTLKTFGTKALDYVIARNLQSAKAKAANSNRAPAQSDVSPYSSWGNPSGARAPSNNSSTMILVGVGALLIILLFFMRGK
jgi:hypothetical protein